MMLSSVNVRLGSWRDRMKGSEKPAILILRRISLYNVTRGSGNVGSRHPLTNCYKTNEKMQLPLAIANLFVMNLEHGETQDAVLSAPIPHSQDLLK